MAIDLKRMMGGDDDDFPVNSNINTTPLVDIMLVLLIIFLITVPVVLGTVPVKLPPESNIVTQTTPQNINIAVDKEGNFYWNQMKITEEQMLLMMAKEAPKKPQPEVHIRGDVATPYEFVGRVVEATQKSGIVKVGFISEPPPKGYR